MPLLSRTLHLVLPDQRGVDESAKPADGYALRDAVDDVIALLDALGFCFSLPPGKIDGSGSSVRIGTVCDGNDGDKVSRLVDAVDHPVGSTAGAVPVLQRWLEAFADALGVVEQWAHDELVGGRRDGLGEAVGELAAGGG